MSLYKLIELISNNPFRFTGIGQRLKAEFLATYSGISNWVIREPIEEGIQTRKSMFIPLLLIHVYRQFDIWNPYSNNI